jgi:hypothetical protein
MSVQETPVMTASLDAAQAPSPSGRRLGAACLAAGALLTGAVALLNPYAGTDDLVSLARDETTALTVYSLVWLAASLLLLAGVCTIVGRVRGRGRGLVLVGGTLSAGAAVASATVAAFEAVPISLASALSDDTALDAALRSFDSSVVLGLVFALWLLGSVVGMPLLVGGAARAGLVGRWWWTLVLIALVGQVVAPSDGPQLLTLVLIGCFVVPMATVARVCARA